MSAQHCDRCGGVLTLGAWPWCPHGHPGGGVQRDAIPGGRVFENGFAQPTRFDSYSAHRRALAARGLEIRAAWAGPGDRHCGRWATVDLDGATALVSRRPARWPQATTPITVTDLADTVQARDLP